MCAVIITRLRLDLHCGHWSRVTVWRWLSGINERRIIPFRMSTNPSQEEYLIRGHNGLETCVILSEEGLLGKRKFMERDTVKDVLRRFNEGGVRYCLVGGLALAHHSIPRQTQDVDIMEPSD